MDYELIAEALRAHAEAIEEGRVGSPEAYSAGDLVRAADELIAASESESNPDTRRLDKIERLGLGGVPWVAKQCWSGKGFVVRQEAGGAAYPSVREAIDNAEVIGGPAEDLPVF